MKMNERDEKNSDKMNDRDENNPDELNEMNEMNEERDNMDEVDERQTLGLSPAANPWVVSSKPGGPTGTSPAPSPLPSNLNDPIFPLNTL